MAFHLSNSGITMKTVIHKALTLAAIVTSAALTGSVVAQEQKVPR